MHDLHHLDFLELVLPDEPPYVLAVRPGLAAETRRVGRVFQREGICAQDFITMEVGQGHFGSRNQEQIPLAADLEQLRFEFRELSCGFERRAIDEIWRD